MLMPVPLFERGCEGKAGLVVVLRPYHVGCRGEIRITLLWLRRWVDTPARPGKHSPNSAVGWVREGNGDIQVAVAPNRSRVDA